MNAQHLLTDDFPFESHFTEVNGHRIHYVDVGSGDPVLFLHGNPTSSYLWRNIIPFLSDRGRCIAPDLIGFGRSERPDMDYRFVTHSDYLHKFIAKLDLQHLTLVLHDWGAALGFHYGLHHLGNIKGFAFMEAGNRMEPSPTLEEFNCTQPKEWFARLRDPIHGPEIFRAENPFLSNLQRNVLGRRLSDVAWQKYKAPFQDPDSRKPMWTFPMEFPIAGKPRDVFEIVNRYSEILQTCSIPKLMFYGTPGWSAPAKVVQWAEQHIRNLVTIDIGPGYHFFPEDNPILIGEELRKWFERLADPPHAREVSRMGEQ